MIWEKCQFFRRFRVRQSWFETASRQIEIFFFSLAVLSFVCPAWSQESVPDVVETASSPSRLQLYSETYTSPFSKSPVNFQRASYDVKRFGNQGSYKFFVAGERYSDEDSINGTAELGIYKTFTDHIFSVASIRREYISDPSRAVWVGRAGVIFSQFFDLKIPHTFADTYGEAFYRIPNGQQAGATFSGWAKLGYRCVSTDHFSLDPLLTMVRAFDSTDRTYLGADYQSINVGSQMTYYTPAPDFSVNLMVARAFTHSYKSADAIVNKYWMLFAIGANF